MNNNNMNDLELTYDANDSLANISISGLQDSNTESIVSQKQNSINKLNENIDDDDDENEFNNDDVSDVDDVSDDDDDISDLVTDSDEDNDDINDQDDDENIEESNFKSGGAKNTLKSKKKNNHNNQSLPDNTINIPSVFEKQVDDYISDSDEEEDDYLQKFDKELRENYIATEHPESIVNNYDEVYNLAKVQRNKDNIVIDKLHKTIPLLTKYEKTKILGLRAKQLNNGAVPYVKINSNIIDGYLIALKELEEKKIPFIVRRPLPSGISEYWHLQDLEII